MNKLREQGQKLINNPPASGQIPLSANPPLADRPSVFVIKTPIDKDKSFPLKKGKLSKN